MILILSYCMPRNPEVRQSFGSMIPGLMGPQRQAPAENFSDKPTMALRRDRGKGQRDGEEDHWDCDLHPRSYVAMKARGNKEISLFASVSKCLSDAVRTVALFGVSVVIGLGLLAA